MLYATLVTSTKELQEILQLQKDNLPQNIDNAEMQSQGFVTFQHSLEILQKFHELAPSIIVKDDDKVIAYALTVINKARYIFPPMESMFTLFDTLEWESRPLNSYRYYEMGQICVAKAYRASGIFEMLYEQHKKEYSNQYDLLITKISTKNIRSLKAHQRIGFQTITTQKDELGEWYVVLWGWENPT